MTTWAFIAGCLYLLGMVPVEASTDRAGLSRGQTLFTMLLWPLVTLGYLPWQCRNIWRGR